MSDEKTLFIQLFQSFAQYRNPFTFYYAQTYPLPPKSTIIGMLQNAVGDWYGAKDNIENWWNLKVSVHGGFESVFWHYQKLIKGDLNFGQNGIWINKHDNNPGGNIWLPVYSDGIISQRTPVYQQELFNGHLYIFVRGKEEIIDNIKKAIERPTKILFLGRSEDVVFVKKVSKIQPERKVNNVEGDLKVTFPTYILQDDFPIKDKKYPVFSIPVKVLFKNNESPVKHKAEINKSTTREVEFKTVIYIGYDYSIILNENKFISVEFYKIDDKEIRIIDLYGWL